MGFRRLFPVGLFSLTVAALGLCISPAAVATHSTTTTTSSGTSTCKLCTHIQWQIEAGDLLYEDSLLNSNGTILYTNRPGRTITGKVCTDANQTECATAEFHIPDGQNVRCTGFALKGCEKSGRRDSLKTFTQQCGAPTTDPDATSPLADCVGRLEAVTNGATITSPKGLISITDGYGVNLGGAAQAAQNNDCTAVFKNEPGAFATKEMGRIVQRHLNSTQCDAGVLDIVDESQKQRACSSLSSTDESAEATCYRQVAGDVVATPAIAMTQDFLPIATGSCLPGTMQSGCTVDRDSGVFRQLVTGAELSKLGVNPNQVDASQFKCGDKTTGIAPISVTPTNMDGDTLLDWDIRCSTCNRNTGVFLCLGGECFLYGTDGAQQFVSRCEVTLQ